ncbi:N-acetylmuramoyl-L-alanine amidase [Cetobacterium sp. 2A]|uniref:N-acetylmuramoyl-L-alanine amidase family protein n=1 Tax=Cetobacterium sp. 2A TaxID=2754723 RepID=UPI00163C20EF|nr:N-acetylmuramoyl-L-alanine amidase [Cetobacterium sp. 2A]MBC2856069.1 N-acetylmuramoyl-L-alanine amidase [Cetobacterium sp. 2A]
MRKIIKLVLFFLFTVGTFCNSVGIKNVKLGRNSSELIIELSAKASPKYSSSYDEYNRLLFIEVEKGKMLTKFDGKKFTGKYIEKIDMMDYGGTVGVFIKLKKDVGYKIKTLKNPHRIVVALDNGAAKKQFTVVIDPGHGGKDPGAIGFNRYKEKDIVLDVGRYLQNELGKDFKVVMTRSDDRFVTLSDRSKVANRVKADLFISLHINSSETSSSNGMEIFYFSKKSSPYASRVASYENSFGEKYGEKTGSIAQIMGELSYNKNMEKSIGLAKPLNDAMAIRMRMKNRGIHGANFAVLRGFNGPGILVELGFINNKNDVAKLKSPVNQKIMAQEIAKKIKGYFY